MLRLAPLLAAVAGARAGVVDVTVTDCCTAACKGTIKKLDNPGTCPTPGVCNAGGSGTLNVDVTDAKMELTLTLAGAKILDKTTDACGDMNINLPLGLGSVAITALAACPAKVGPINVGIVITNKIAIPGKIISHSVTKDQDGSTLLCLDLSFTPEKTPAEHDAERQRVIDATNAKQDEWVAHHNPRFRGSPVGVSKALCGLLPGETGRIDTLVAAGEMEVVEADPTMAIPDEFEAATGFPQCAKVINDIRDQSNCGCCWAFSAAEAGSDRLCIQTNGSNVVPLSAQDMCFCSNSNGCGGGSQASAWNYIKSHGLVTGEQQQPDDGKTDPFAGGGFCSPFSLPHCHHHGPVGNDPYPAEGAKGCPSESSPKCPTSCSASAKAPHKNFASDKYKVSGVSSYRSADAMAQAIMKGGPISVGFSVYSDFENYASGIYHHTSGSSLGGHAVRIVGFGVSKGASKRQYWKVANSWNPYWGEKGYFRIRRGNNEVGIEGSAVASSANAKWTVPK